MIDIDDYSKSDLLEIICNQERELAAARKQVGELNAVLEAERNRIRRRDAIITTARSLGQDELERLQQQYNDSLAERSKLNQLLADALAERNQAIKDRIEALDCYMEAERAHTKVFDELRRTRDELYAVEYRLKEAEQEREKEIIAFLEQQADKAKQNLDVAREGSAQRHFENGILSALIHAIGSIKEQSR